MHWRMKDIVVNIKGRQSNEKLLQQATTTNGSDKRW